MSIDPSSLPPAVRVRRALGRLRRSPALERATGFFALHHRRAHQRLRSRFVRGVWLHTEDYLASAAAGEFGSYHHGADTGGRTVAGAPTFVPQPPADSLAGGIVVERRPAGVAELLLPWLVGPAGAVIGRDRQLLWDLSYEWPGRPQWHTTYHLRELSATDLPGTTVTLAAMGADKNYFHFLLNSVARLAYLEPFLSSSEPDRYLVSGPVTPLVMETLAFFGIPAGRVVGTAEFPASRPERLIAPPLVHHPFMVPPQVCAFLRQKVLAALPPRRGPRRRLFIDRSDADTRRIANLDELARTFADFGLEPVRLSWLSFAEQAQLFRDAELVIANHGAALSNLVFCDPGTRVLQVLAPGMMEREYRTISHHGALRHDYIVAAFATPADAALPRKQRDLNFSPELLRRVLHAEGWSI